MRETCGGGPGQTAGTSNLGGNASAKEKRKIVGKNLLRGEIAWTGFNALPERCRAWTYLFGGKKTDKSATWWEGERYVRTKDGDSP